MSDPELDGAALASLASARPKASKRQAYLSLLPSVGLAKARLAASKAALGFLVDLDGAQCMRRVFEAREAIREFEASLEALALECLRVDGHESTVKRIFESRFGATGLSEWKRRLKP